MKRNLAILSLLLLMGIGSANAQSKTDLIGVKTDPVLSNPLDLISVKTDPVLKPRLDSPEGLNLNFAPKGTAGFSLNFSSPDKLRGFSLNFQPVIDLLKILSSKGAKVETRVVESNGLSILEIKVNGQAITPIAAECRDCVIVFEY